MKNEEKKYHIPLLLIRCFLPESNLVHKGSRMNWSRRRKNTSIFHRRIMRVIDLLSPSTDDYLYFIDFRTDFYYIAPQSLERFCVPQNAFYNVLETHRNFVYAEIIRCWLPNSVIWLTTNRCIHNMEYRWLDLNGNPVWINCRGYLVRDDYQKPLYMVGCINEIGEKQKADNISGTFRREWSVEYLKTRDSSGKWISVTPWYR